MATSPLSEFGKLVKLELKLIRNENAQQRSGMACCYKANITNLAINADMDYAQVSRYLHLDNNGNPKCGVKLETLMRLIAVLGPSEKNAKRMLESCGFSIDGNYAQFVDYKKVITLAREDKLDEINTILEKYSDKGVTALFHRKI